MKRIALSALTGAITLAAISTTASDLAPRQHIETPAPAILSPGDAERIYAGIASRLATQYGFAEVPAITGYQRWNRANSYPYQSQVHGSRYVNNFTNAAAAAYLRYEEAGDLPLGAVIAKDSFTVTDSGAVHPGPMFVMEKMQAGFEAATGDWRYTMIMPDGSLLGTTGGTGSEAIAFCSSCHAARAATDYLFFVPPAARRHLSGPGDSRPGR